MVDLNKSAPPPLPSHHQADDEILLLDTPNSLSVMAGKNWFINALEIFRESPLVWLGASFLMVIIPFFLSFFPKIGELVSGIASFLFFVGFVYMAHQQVTEGETAIDELFIGFKHRFVKILILYILAVSAMALVLISALFFILMINPSLTLYDVLKPQSFYTLVIVLLLFSPISFATWFAPILILFYDVNVFQSMKMSFIGTIKNLLPISIYGLMMMVLFVISLIPLGLGLFAFLPVAMIANYFIFREIFTEV